ncbi:MAG: hypothetical protein KGR26_08030 [Cyanobacteria bacterium REEB65]|nr:hypothetical protein [Cyanobacteria bacterium REEB65]
MDSPLGPASAFAPSPAEVEWPRPAGAALIPEIDPGEAQAADQELDRLVGIVKEPLCRLALVIHQIRDRQLFRALSFESFEAYISSKQLQFSRSFIYQLAKVGKMLAASGFDPAALPDRDLEITKLAQIARLPDPAEQRRVVETGFFHVDDEDRHLREIPVRQLAEHVDRRLGREPRSGAVRTLSETYDDAVPWRPEAAGDEETRSFALPATAFQEMRISEAAHSDWQRLLDDLAEAIRPLRGPERDNAINALSRLYQELVGF